MMMEHEYKNVRGACWCYHTMNHEPWNVVKLRNQMLIYITCTWETETFYCIWLLYHENWKMHQLGILRCQIFLNNPISLSWWVYWSDIMYLFAIWIYKLSYIGLLSSMIVAYSDVLCHVNWLQCWMYALSCLSVIGPLNCSWLWSTNHISMNVL